MATVKFTYALKRFFPDLKEMNAAGNTLTEVFNEVEASYPKVRSYLLDEHGSLRGHVNIFIDGNIIEDRDGLSDRCSPNSEIDIMQA